MGSRPAPPGTAMLPLSAAAVTREQNWPLALGHSIHLLWRRRGLPAAAAAAAAAAPAPAPAGGGGGEAAAGDWNGEALRSRGACCGSCCCFCCCCCCGGGGACRDSSGHSCCCCCCGRCCSAGGAAAARALLSRGARRDSCRLSVERSPPLVALLVVLRVARSAAQRNWSASAPLHTRRQRVMRGAGVLAPGRRIDAAGSAAHARCRQGSSNAQQAARRAHLRSISQTTAKDEPPCSSCLKVGSTR